MPSSWYRSLYWRIAIGFVLALAAMLVVQAVLFVWVLSRTGPTLPGQPPDRFAQTVALDLAQQLTRDPSGDISQYLSSQYGRDAHPFFVMMADGAMFSNGGPFPEPLIRDARARLARGPELERTPDPDVADGPARGRGPRRAPDFGGPPGGRGGPGFRPVRPTPVIVNGQLAAVVVVPPQAPFGFLLGRYAPTLALVAAGALGIGAALAALTIFGPARRRLRAVEDAARRLGGGDLTARAPAQGGDEVAAVATAFNAMADDLSERATALAASDQARRQLLADVSHELNTPVTAMRGYIETLTMPDFPIDEAKRVRYLSIVGEETARLERIIRDLLDLARLEGGGGSLIVEEVPVATLFERVVARHERASSEANVRFATLIEPRAEIVRCDRDRIEQALQNLAANALRHAPSGTTVGLGARPSGTGVLLTVTDHGPGIAPEHLPYVFDRFYKGDASRASRTGANAGGSGLGLSIVKAIVERHGGAVSVTSEPGRTVFSLNLGTGIVTGQRRS
jgi:signal transduction histidine kinase